MAKADWKKDRPPRFRVFSLQRPTPAAEASARPAACRLIANHVGKQPVSFFGQVDRVERRSRRVVTSISQLQF
jgi:hypothetical protein